ncbi:muconolactone Delta-isomerase family protein [Streptomyces javensis]|uniref:muconolactone Delta-isomerase n=1 Tax=Streptomyces javensis TaxID=114698 RepID=UPI0033E0E3E1
MPDFLVSIDTSGVFALPAAERADVVARERDAGRELIAEGVIQKIWRIPAQHRNIGVWTVPDADALHRVLTGLPIFPYAEFDVTALSTHPLYSDDYGGLIGPGSEEGRTQQ